MAPDSTAACGVVPRETAEPSVALRLFRMIRDHPYRWTSDEVIFAVYADRNGIPARGRAAARAEFFSRSQPCLRACDLGKKHGWGIHSDAEGRVALYGVESVEYRAFVEGRQRSSSGAPVTVTQAMRSRRR
ncbi:MAG: DUF6157 family protein, partial [Dehalococcoidia bacterium]